jgi:hypothetical protein
MATNTIPKVYDPKSTVVLIGQVEPTQYAPNTKLVISRSESISTPQAGVNGSVAIAINANTLGTLTLSLKNVSDFNTTLMVWMQIYENEDNYDYFFPVYIYDSACGMGIECYGWVEEQPDFTLGQEIGQMDWVIGLSDARVKNLVYSTAYEKMTAANTDS